MSRSCSSTSGWAAAESQQHLGQEAEDAGDAEPDAQRAGLAACRPLDERDDLRRILKHLPSACGEQASRLGQPHVAIAAHQQTPADPLFHALHAFAQRRLRHVQPFRRAAEVQRLRQDADRADR